MFWECGLLMRLTLSLMSLVNERRREAPNHYIHPEGAIINKIEWTISPKRTRIWILTSLCLVLSLSRSILLAFLTNHHFMNKSTTLWVRVIYHLRQILLFNGMRGILTAKWSGTLTPSKHSVNLDTWCLIKKVWLIRIMSRLQLLNTLNGRCKISTKNKKTRVWLDVYFLIFSQTKRNQ